MKTHRCEGSLKNHMSLRYTTVVERFSYGDLGWQLRKRDYDSEWDSTYLNWCCTVDYCPFCGMKLEKPKEVTTDA